MSKIWDSVSMGDMMCRLEEEKMKQRKGYQYNLCDSCMETIPECPGDDIIYGTGKGNDNVAACSAYKPKTAKNIQAILKVWHSHNFPDITADEQFKLIIEEIGEFARADIKSSRMIKGFTKDIGEQEIINEMGDILVGIYNYCSIKHISVQECIDKAAEKVLQRDWRKFPQNGRDK